MDYFQGVVIDFLRANRETFVNEECCIQLNPGDNPDRTGPHWFCDAVAIQPARRAAFLCEISYSKTLSALLERLRRWNEHWSGVLVALQRDSGIPADWDVRPWLFVPGESRKLLDKSLPNIVGPSSAGAMPHPKVTPLEDTLPWKYQSWNRRLDD